MRWYLNLLAAFLVLGSVALAQTPTPEAAVLQLENQQRLNLAVGCLDSDRWEAEPGQVTRVDLHDPEVRVFDGHTAIVTGTWQVQTLRDGHNVQSSRRFTHLWVQVDGAWRLVTHHLAMD